MIELEDQFFETLSNRGDDLEYGDKSENAIEEQ